MADPNRPQDPNRTYVADYYEAATAAEISAPTGSTKDAQGNDISLPNRLMNYAKAAVSEGRRFQSDHTRTEWQNSYRMFRNEHPQNSKYRSTRWKARTKLFRPKTRTAVRKTDATAAAALFSTADVVSIQAEREGDPQQRASAAVLSAIMEYRMDRQNSRAGFPWFMVAMTARQDSQIAAVCFSKQFWEFKEVETGEFETSVEPVDGEPDVYEMIRRPKMKKVKDRPMSKPLPPENVLIDPAAYFIDPIQSAAYVILREPMHVDDAWTWIESNGDNGDAALQWYDLDKTALMTRGNTGGGHDAKGVRQAREEGRDRYEINSGTHELETVWIHENFIRLEGVDYHFYSIEDHTILTVPVPVETVYPEQHGDRPVVMGYGTLEAHRLFPMSNVSASAGLQMEANDVANLRLDNIKNVVSPVTKVKRGKRIDLKQVQNRSPDAVIQVDDLEDIEFDRPPDVTRSSYEEQDRINADMDDLNGTFSGGSVMTNRALNETVGGMKMLSGSANAVSEFDLRVWVETWVEPVLRQIVRLEQYYESDDKIITIAGEKAKLFEKFHVSEVTDEMLMSDVTVRVNVGIGSADPVMQLQKLDAAMGIIGKTYGQEFLTAASKAGEFITEVMGKAGYKDADRLFDLDKVEELQKGPTPREKELIGRVRELEDELRSRMGVEKLRGENTFREAALDAASDYEIARMNNRTDMAGKLIDSRDKEQSDRIKADADRMGAVRDNVRTLTSLLPKPGQSSGGERKAA